jgi:outer membrane receptor for ferrienterochelin and colicins
MKHRICLLLALTLAQTVWGQHEEKLDTAFNLHELVVTGTRTPKLLKDTPVQTRLISSDDIHKADATNVQDLLQTELPGVEFSYAMDQQTHLNFAGFSGQSILFLVDGERLAGETMDDVDFQRLTMNNVERIEIIRGASSALYGSNAGGGVINIITKEASRPWTLNVNSRLSRHNSQRYGVSFSTHGQHASNNLDFSYNGIDNYNVNNGPNPQTRVFSTVYGDKTFHITDKVTLCPWDGFRLTGQAGYFIRTLSRTTDIPERYRDFNGRLSALWKMTEKDHVELSYNFDEYDKSDYYKLTRHDICNYSNVENSVRGVWNHSFVNTGILTIGVEYLHDYLFNTNLDGHTREQDCFDIFTQMDWIISPRWEMVSALRYDYFSDVYHSQITPKLTVRYKTNDHLTLRMSYGMGFRAPTLKEKYYNFDMAGIWIVEGNAQLRPETSHNLNASAEWTKGRYNITATVYHNSVANKLSTGLPHSKTGNSEQLFLEYLNLDNFTVYGAEATFHVRWDKHFGTRMSYAYTKESIAKDESGLTVNSQYLPARQHTLTTRIDWQHQLNKRYELNVTLHGRFHSSVDNREYADYYDISKGIRCIHYPAYTLWKLSTAHHIGKAITLTLAIDNILNYRPKYYYLNAPITDGASLQAGIAIDLDRL